MNISTSSSDRNKQQFGGYFRRYCLVFLTTITLTVAVSFAVLLWKPEMLYWQAWQYMDEIVYPNPRHSGVWDGFERGDLSRRYFFSFQERWKTHVSIDREGFRSVPFEAENYPVLVVGDSHIWGSGLSDDETFPWKLAVKLETPVFNAGRHPFYLERVITNPRVKNARIIIELVASHLITPEIFTTDFLPQPYAPLRRAQKTLLAAVPFKRYFLPSKIFRIMTVRSIIFNPVEWFSKHSEYAGTNSFFVTFTDEDMAATVLNIKHRSETLRRMGYEYLFIPVPEKGNIYSPRTNEYSVRYYSRLVRLLKENNVHSIDLVPIFLAHKDEGVFRKSDTHWSPRGVELAVETAADYIRTHDLLR